MPAATNILQMVAAQPASDESDLPPMPYDLDLAAGDLALIEVRNSGWAAEFADLCSGLIRLMGGSVTFLGRDWTGIPATTAAALRGAIGRAHGKGAWIDFAGADINIMLPQLHHTARPPATLRDAAAHLAHAFGLPGLPLVRPAALSADDLARAVLVRAFLGEPRLLLLEHPVKGQMEELVAPLLNALAAARDRGAAGIWLTGSDLVWNDRSFPATARFRLTESGLFRLRTPT